MALIFNSWKEYLYHMQDLPQKLNDKLSKRRTENALRTIKEPTYLIDFTSNDYLGMARNETIFSKASEIVATGQIVKNGATGSRLLSGNYPLYAQLENLLCDFHESKSALVFNSGYDANIGFFSCVPQRNDLIFYDALIHASIRDGIKMGNTRSIKFLHNDLSDLRNKCEAEQARCQENAEIYIVTEAVFSMDGDNPDLRAMVDLCNTYNYRLIVDEAHSVGIYGTKGQGMVQELGMEKEVFARIVTFGKALGCHGATILGSSSLRTYLVNFARSLIYTTALPPHAISTIIACYKFLSSSEGSKNRTQLMDNIQYFNQEIDSLNLRSHFIPSTSAIQSCIVPGTKRVKEMAKNLKDSGFDVRPILPPTVEVEKERLRFCLHSFNTEKQISKVLQIVKQSSTQSHAQLGR